MLGVEVVFARPEISDSGSDVPRLIDRKAIPTGGPSRAKHTTSDQKNDQGQKYAPIIQPIHQPSIIPPGALRGLARSRRSTVRGCCNSRMVGQAEIGRLLQDCPSLTRNRQL